MNVCENCGDETTTAELDGGDVCKECATEMLGGDVKVQKFSLGGVTVHKTWIAA